MIGLYPLRAEVAEESLIMLNEILSIRFTYVAFDRQISMQKEGRLVDKFSGDNVDSSTLSKTGLEPLREGYRNILNQIYATKFY